MDEIKKNIPSAPGKWNTSQWALMDTIRLTDQAADLLRRWLIARVGDNVLIPTK